MRSTVYTRSDLQAEAVNQSRLFRRENPGHRSRMVGWDLEVSNRGARLLVVLYTHKGEEATERRTITVAL